MKDMTTVVHLPTGTADTYSLPPKHTLVAAYEQHRGNWNTWAYGKPEEYPIVEGLYTFLLGEYAVRKG